MTTDWTCNLYCGITIKCWDYTKQTIECSMPGYVAKALQRFEPTPPTHAQHAPSPFSGPVYGQQVQLTPVHDETALIDPTEITRLQEIISVFLDYGQAIDNTMLAALGSLAATQSYSTTATAKEAVLLHPDATIHFYVSNTMCLHIHSDETYLSEESKSCS
jgi:hypothetical protein